MEKGRRRRERGIGSNEQAGLAAWMKGSWRKMHSIGVTCIQNKR